MRNSVRILASVSGLAIGIWSVAAAHAQTTPAPQTSGPPATPTTAAPQPPEADPADIVVTGLRGSLASAQAIKRNSEQIVDSITAQDIGKFPDTNIAESLQRISGIQIQRNLGEGSTVAIRGLSEVRTELNGHDIFTANGGVGLAFDEVGPDLLSRVDVFKNPSAEMIEGSLGGTIDLRTRKPFDAPGRIIAATVSGTEYDLAKKKGWGGSALYSNRWHTGLGEIGVLLNASYQRSFFRQDLDQVEPYNIHGPNADPGGAPVQSTLVPGYAGQNIQVQKGGGFNVAQGDRKRQSISGVLQWRPADNVEAYAQVLSTTYKFTDTGVAYFASDDGAAPTGTYTVANGIATSGALSNPGGLSVTYGSNRKTRTTDITTGVKWSVTDRLKVVFDYQHIDSTVKQDSLNLYITPYTKSGGVAGLFNQSYNYAFDNRGKFPTQLATDPVTGGPSNFFANTANYGFTAYQPDRISNSAIGNTPRLDLTWDFDDGGFLKSLSAGVRYSSKTAINRDTNVNNWTTIGGTCANYSTAASCYLVSAHPEVVENNPGQATLLRGTASNSVFGPILQWNLYDALHPDSAFAHIKAISGQNAAFGSLDDPTQSTTSRVSEKDYSAYARAAFGTHLGGMDLDGNVGLRYVKTDASASGFQILTYRTAGATDSTSTSVVQPYNGGRSYDTFLPSVNLRLHVTPKLQARFAFSKNIFRPTFAQLNPTFTLSPNYNGSNSTPLTVNSGQPYNAVTNPYQGSGSVAGNPNLKPERVTSFDAAAEWYFEPTGYIALTLFRKNLRDIIDTRTSLQTQNIAGVGAVQFNVSAVTNVTKGFVQGFEVAGQKFFDFLPGPLSGFGVAANFTLADSDAGTLASGNVGSQTQFKVPLINLSRTSYNLIALYDKYGVTARVAYNWRSKYLDSVSENGAATLPIYFKAYGSLDASIGYQLNRWASITLDGQNLSDSVAKSYQGDPNLLRNYQINDRRVSVRLQVRY
ncbi:TonB-dependent receptor [Sphingomonas glacialis]|uniref:TonB-dependent receptor n=1 Tax=Sphingomonas glacialis TaxID=658225 RepID=A0A502FJ45_9SPHN|nr:TonB-dependent receptor [Sphingomonas glacialis]TPG49399.1 TonB-dependent receptor [Sphingomonas glacialis]